MALFSIFYMFLAFISVYQRWKSGGTCKSVTPECGSFAFWVSFLYFSHISCTLLVTPAASTILQMTRGLLLLSLCLCLLIGYIFGDCSQQNFCNGHGTCQNATSICLCHDGWGSENDVTIYKSPDCSLRVCPSDRAWADIPTGPRSAHAVMECSNRGVCDRSTGLCSCFEGFAGSACQRTSCPNDCSGHGVCVSLKQMARMSNALPLAPNTYYEGAEDGSTWDEDKIYGCVCDSSWPVGLGAGETQEPEWFGPDCSLRKFLPVLRFHTSKLANLKFVLSSA